MCVPNVLEELHVRTCPPARSCPVQPHGQSSQGPSWEKPTWSPNEGIKKYMSQSRHIIAPNSALAYFHFGMTRLRS